MGHSSLPVSQSTPFASNLYKIAADQKGTDKGDVSFYFQRYHGGWKEAGYDGQLFGLWSNRLRLSTLVQSFESSLALGGWAVQTTHLTTGGQFVNEVSTVRSLNGTSSFHSRAKVTATSFGSGGIVKDFAEQFVSSPLASGIVTKIAIFPQQLEDPTNQVDSAIIIRFDFNLWDSRTDPPKMIFVIQDDPSEVTGLPYSNGTRTVVYVLNRQRIVNLNVWSIFTWDITALATQKFGGSQAMDMRITKMKIESWSRNSAVSEFYADGLRMSSSKTNDQSYEIFSNIINRLSSPDFLMVPGIGDFAFNNDVLWPRANVHATPGQTSQRVLETNLRGGYPFLIDPNYSNIARDDALQNLYDVNGVSVWSGKNPGGWDTTVWNAYLNRGRAVGAIATTHAYFLRHILDFTEDFPQLPATFVYADQLNAEQVIEAIAMGRGFVEDGWIQPAMPLYFAAENDIVPMGRFPILVSPSQATARLHVRLTNVPTFSAPFELRMIRNGTVLESIPILGGTPVFDRTFTYGLPDRANNFRFEVWSTVTGRLVAVSNPIIYAKTESILPGSWFALVPPLSQGAARARIEGIVQTADSTRFVIYANLNVPVTAKIYSERSPVQVFGGGVTWSYDPITKILSINTSGTTQVHVSYAALYYPNLAVPGSLWAIDRAFGANVYKVGSHLHTVDEGTVSHHYYRYTGGFVENGFDALLFTATTGDLHPQTLVNPSFELSLSPDWTTESSGSTIPGSYLVERTTASALDGTHSLRVKTAVPGTSFGYSAAKLDLYKFPISAPLASKIVLSFGIYPVMMTDASVEPDSLFVLELKLSHWDSSTVQPSVLLVVQDNPNEGLTQPLFQNSTNALVISLNRNRQLLPQAWNTFTYNITNVVASHFGLSQALDSAILTIRAQAYSRNGAVSEFFFDKLSWATPWSAGVKSRRDSEVYPILQQIVNGYSTPTMLMVPGLHVTSDYAHMAYFNAPQYRISTQGPQGAQTDIDYVHSQGDYIFLTHPAGRNTYLTNATARLYTVDGITAYSSVGSWNNVPVWDYYLSRSRGDFATVGYAEFDIHTPLAIDYFTHYSPVTYTYGTQRTPEEIIEALAQGRLFMEYETVVPKMPVYFTAEFDGVPMGRFPIYVSPSHKAQLHVRLSSIPLDDHALYMIRNGTVIETVRIPRGTTVFDRYFTYSLPDNSNYFRFEVRRVSDNKIRALSNPILYVKRDLPSGAWIAATPSLAYGSAFTKVTDIQNLGTRLKFNVQALPELEVTVRVHTPRIPTAVENAVGWNYDVAAQILTVTARGRAEVTVHYEFLTIIDPNGGTVLVDGQPITVATTYQWQPGSQHTLAATSHVDETSSRVFTFWSDGDSSNPRVITVDGLKTFTAQWFRQWGIGFSAADNTGGQIPGTVRLDYVSNSQPITLQLTSVEQTVWVDDMSAWRMSFLADTAAPIAASALNSENYSFEDMGVHGDHAGTPGTLTVTSDASLDASSESPADERWANSFGSDQVGVAREPAKIRGAYFNQLVLRLESDQPGEFTTSGPVFGAQGTSEAPSEWYDRGGLVSIDVAPTIIRADEGVAYGFLAWTGQGAGSYTGTSPRASLVMNEPIIETASWASIQYRVRITVSPSGAGTTTPAGDYWTGTGDSVAITALNSNFNYFFDHWTVDGNHAGASRTLTVMADVPRDVVGFFNGASRATFNTQDGRQRVFYTTDTVRIGANVTGGDVSIQKVLVTVRAPSGSLLVNNASLTGIFSGTRYNYYYDYFLGDFPTGRYSYTVYVQWSNGKWLKYPEVFDVMTVAITPTGPSTVSRGTSYTLNMQVASLGHQAKDIYVYVDLPLGHILTSARIGTSAKTIFATTSPFSGYTRYYVKGIYLDTGLSVTVALTVSVSTSATPGDVPLYYHSVWGTWQGYRYTEPLETMTLRVQ